MGWDPITCIVDMGLLTRTIQGWLFADMQGALVLAENVDTVI